MIILFTIGFFFNSSFATALPTQSPKLKKVVVILFENESLDSTEKVPEFRALAKRGVSFSQYFGVARPSQPNYFAMIGGSTFDQLTNENVTIDAHHIGDLLEQAGLDWRVYAEDFPGNCFLGERSNEYVRKHNPFISFKNVSTVSSRCQKIRNFSEFSSDWKAGITPQFSMIIPNNRNNGHDTSVGYAGGWLGKRLAEMDEVKGWEFQNLLVVTFDEGPKLGSQRVYMAMVGNGLSAGKRVSTHYDHYSLLKTIEVGFGLPDLGRNDAKASVMDAGW